MFKKFDLRSAPKCAKPDTPGMKVFAMDGDTPTLSIMDDIGENYFGEGVRAVDVSEFLESNPGPVNAKINSFGGSVYEGLAIFNALIEHGEVNGSVEGIAYSAASIVAMGCKTLRMKQASDIGIHRAWTLTQGNSKELQATIEWLNTVDEHQVDIFAEKTGQERGQIESWLDGTSDGTTWTASKAFELGFCDEVIERDSTKVETPVSKSRSHIAATAAVKMYQQRAKALSRK